jgi:hypothetical protein
MSNKVRLASSVNKATCWMTSQTTSRNSISLHTVILDQFWHPSDFLFNGYWQFSPQRKSHINAATLSLRI